MINRPQVEIVPYDKRWPDIFKEEAARIQSVLAPQLASIYHIGSTAMPNMSAKPVIDILLACENLDDIDIISKKLESIQYQQMRRQIIPHRSFFVSRFEGSLKFNLHIHERGSPQIKRHVNFRDYVIHHPEVAQTYVELKKKLAMQYSDNMSAYVSGKDKLVQAIDAKAKCWDGRKKDFPTAHTGPLAKDWQRTNLVKAMEANLNVHMTHFPQYLNQVALIREPGFTIINSGLPDDTFNYVIDADFTITAADERIRDVSAYFQQKSVPYAWWISPHDQPADLDRCLEKHGYINTENNTAMYFDLDAWDGKIISPPELQIVQAKDEKTLIDFALVLANDTAAFTAYFTWIAAILTDDDPIEYYVGYVNGKPVVRGLSCYFAQVAGMHWLSTSPSERHKGYGQAMQAFRLKRAKDLGYHIAVLQASNEGLPLYKKLGYQTCGEFREFKKADR